MERVHVHSADRQELYFEFARFRGLTPQHEYGNHKSHLEQRFVRRNGRSGLEVDAVAGEYRFCVWEEALERRDELVVCGDAVGVCLGVEA
jgi:hypothetical protein